MSALRIIAGLTYLTIELLKIFRDHKLVKEAEISGARKSMEEVRAKLDEAILARRRSRNSSDRGIVRDDDPHLRD